MSPHPLDQTIRDWWNTYLRPRDNNAGPASGAARALSARLRRRGWVEVLAEPAVQDLAARLSARDPAALTRLATLLAELRGTAHTSLPRLLGQGEPRTLSPARFQALMRAEGDDLTTRLRRAIRALGPAEARACDIGALGRDLWLWDDSTRARWSFEYFGTSIPAALQPRPEEPVT